LMLGVSFCMVDVEEVMNGLDSELNLFSSTRV
jgi:hypothetical protein